MADKIVRYHVEGAESFIPGVPLRDLTEEEWDELPDATKADLDASGIYRKSRPAVAKEADKEAPAPPKPVVVVPEGGKPAGEKDGEG